MTTEVKAKDIKLGDIIVAKQGGRRFTVVGIAPGLGGENFPYLSLSCGGERREHDTSLDRRSATYTIFTPDPLVTCRECNEEFDADELIDGVCDDCRYDEECPTCDGTGSSDEWDEDEGPVDCEDCGGDGVI